jgi:hypothetical protein
MIFLTFVGNHDIIDASREGHGAVLTIFFQYKDAITDVYLFVTQPKATDRVSYKEIAEKSKAIMVAEKPEVNVKLIFIVVSTRVFNQKGDINALARSYHHRSCCSGRKTNRQRHSSGS